MFQLGKPVFFLAVLAVATGVMVAMRATPRPSALTVWVFTDEESRTFRQNPLGGGESLIEQFADRTGKSVAVDLIAQRALDARLLSIFMSARRSTATPDLVEIDLSSVGKFFRPPTADIGLLPLNEYLSTSHERERISAARLVTWSKHGVIFGVPRDIHPVTLTYRKDLFDEAGIDLQAPTTWPQFAQKCRDFQAFWRARGFSDRRAIELYSTQSEELLLMLLQRHINLVDDAGRNYLTDPKVPPTVALYARLVAGPGRITADTIPGSAFAYQDLAHGNVCAMITPDWRTGYIKQYAPQLAGKVAMRALPVFDDGDAPTSTWGGTMIGIPRAAKDPATSWQLLQYLCLSRDGVTRRHAYSSVLPPVAALWNDPIYQEGDPFFGGQAIDRLYISLADKIPPRYMTPFSLTAQSALTMVLSRAVGYVNNHGTDGLEDACSQWLAEASGELRHWVAAGDFER